LLAAREGAHVGLGTIGQADEGQRLLDDPAILVAHPAQPALMREPPDCDDLGGSRAHRGGQCMALRHVPQARMVPELVERCPEELHLATDVVVQPEDSLDQGRLAGAVGAQDGDDLTGMNVHADPGDHGAVDIPEGGLPQRHDGLRAILLEVRGSGHEQS